MADDLTNKPKTIAKLGGFPLLNSAPVRWRLAEGVAPVIETFDMIPGHAQQLLLKRGQPLTLELISNEKTIQVKRLYLIFAAPGPNPGIARVTLADCRYWWKYHHVGPRRYNIRRKTGVRRISDWGLAELDVSVPDFAFAPYSTRNGTGSVADRWDAEDVTLDILEDLNQKEARAFGGGFGRPIFSGEAFGNRQLIEDLEIDDKGDSAMQRVLKASPGLGLYINLDGKPVLFNKAGGGEAAAVVTLGPQMIQGGYVSLNPIGNAAVRPREVHVLFTREIEVAFKYTETSPGGTVAQQEKDARFLDNVLPVPDVFLSVAGTKTPRGTYITIDQAITAFGAPDLINRAELDHNWIQMAIVPHNDSWGPMGITGNLDFNADWPPRLQAIQTHYRQTYRINRRWMDRIFQIRAYSVGTIDQTTGQRSPARAYSDHCYMPAKKHLFKRVKEVRAAGQGSGTLELFVNVTGYPPSGKIDGSEIPSPANVTIPDQDQGILHVEYVTDPLRRVEKVLPSKIEATNIPTADITNKRQSISCDTLVKAGKRPKLDDEHRILIVVTAIPASPNTDQQLHRIMVRPQDCSNLVPGGVERDAQGPILEIRVPAGVETARIPWVEAIAEQIEKAFGIRPGVPEFGKYCINQNEGTDGQASLNSIALAEAASAYATYRDRLEGSASGHLNGDVTPKGWLAEVIHEITTEGVGKTTVNLPSEIPALTLWGYLDKGTRAILMHSVEKAA